MISLLCNYKTLCTLPLRFLVKKGGGGGVDDFSLRFIIFLLHGLLSVFSVMSVFSFDIYKA